MIETHPAAGYEFREGSREHLGRDGRCRAASPRISRRQRLSRRAVRREHQRHRPDSHDRGHLRSAHRAPPLQTDDAAHREAYNILCRMTGKLEKALVVSFKQVALTRPPKTDRRPPTARKLQPAAGAPARYFARPGMDRQASPSASNFMSSRHTASRSSRLNSSEVKGRLGSSSTGRRTRGPNNRRTRLASRRMLIPSRQQQTFHLALNLISSRAIRDCKGRPEESALKNFQKGIISSRRTRCILSIGKSGQAHEVAVRLAIGPERHWRQRSRQDSPSRHRS